MEPEIRTAAKPRRGASVQRAVRAMQELAWSTASFNMSLDAQMDYFVAHLGKARSQRILADAALELLDMLFCRIAADPNLPGVTLAGGESEDMRTRGAYSDKRVVSCSHVLDKDYVVIDYRRIAADGSTTTALRRAVSFSSVEELRPKTVAEAAKMATFLRCGDVPIVM